VYRVLAACGKAFENKVIQIDNQLEAKRALLSDDELVAHNVRIAKGAKYIGSLGMGAVAVTALVTAPQFFLLPAFFAVKWCIRNWKEQNEAIHQKVRS
jgi:hypothetical protein